MFHTQIVEISYNEPVIGEYLSRYMTGSRAMRNTANFYIRNVMTGLRKSPEERTANETEVLHFCFTGIHMSREKATAKIRKLEDAIAVETDPDILKKLKEKRSRVRMYDYPTDHEWYLEYERLDAIFKETENRDYRFMSSQVAQAAIKKTAKSWESYFASRNAYKASPDSFTGKPGIPGYLRDRECTATWTNQVSHFRIRNGLAYLELVHCNTPVCIGKADTFSNWKYVRCEAVPYMGKIRLCATFEDGLKAPVVPEHPKKIVGIDLGLRNFAAVANNFGDTPWVIPGGAVISANQWYNKRRAQLLSKLTTGTDSSHSRKTSKALYALSRRRSDQMRDMFYKMAHAIVRYSAQADVDVIVVTHNKGQKQEINLGKKTTQSFVSIPFDLFRQTLRCVAAEAGIPVVCREESYTSQASSVDLDPVPDYGEPVPKGSFSGKRTKRGLYITKEGHLMNADVNGAANVIRKEYPDAFQEQRDLSYLWKTTGVFRMRDVNKAVGKKKIHKEHRPGTGAVCRHWKHNRRKTEYRKMFKWTKTPYVPESGKEESSAA